MMWYTRLGLIAGLLLVLAGCEAATAPSQSPALPASPTTYPDLASVPPRPVLPETIEQRGEIRGELLAARQQAQERAAELAYQVGRGPAPPPRPAPVAAAPVAAPAAVRPAGDGAIARAYLDSSLNDVRDRGKLRQFMRRIGREAPDPAGPRTVAEALGLSTSAAPGESAPQAAPTGQQADPLERFGDFSDDAFNPFK